MHTAVHNPGRMKPDGRQTKLGRKGHIKYLKRQAILCWFGEEEIGHTFIRWPETQLQRAHHLYWMFK